MIIPIIGAQAMMTHTIILAVLGLFFSIYSYRLDYLLKKDQNYKPFCDISDRFSCSKPLLSPYNKMFGISNSLLGIFFYLSIIICALLCMKTALFWLSITGCFASAVLFLILVTQIKSFCVVCVSMYIINVLLLVTQLRK